MINNIIFEYMQHNFRKIQLIITANYEFNQNQKINKYYFKEISNIDHEINVYSLINNKLRLNIFMQTCYLSFN